MTRQRRTPILCPTCGKPMTRVVETVPWQGTVRRKRACADGHSMLTKEVFIRPAA